MDGKVAMSIVLAMFFFTIAIAQSSSLGGVQQSLVEAM